MPGALGLFGIDEQFVEEGRAIASVTRSDVFEFGEAFEVALYLHIAPAHSFPDVAAAEPAKLLVSVLFLYALAHQVLDGIQEAARLRRQFVK